MTLKNNRALMILSAIAVIALLAGLFVIYDPFDILRGFSSSATASDPSAVRVPILMYHHFDSEGAPGTTITAEMFDSQLSALCDAGYETISFDELCDFVYNGDPLPALPLMITIDDGYMSVYDTAFPILKKYGMKATVFIIGISHGRSVYRNTSRSIIPHFGDTEANEMVESGLISIQTHSYDMHHYEPYETGPFREGILQMAGESDEDYISAFKADFQSAADQLESIMGTRLFVYSYPYGVYSDFSEILLRELGVKVTLTIEDGMNTIKKDSPESLFRLNRFNVPGDTTPERLLRMISR